MVVISFLETKQDPAPAMRGSLETSVGCFYELDHSKLPPKAPELLKSVRIVMVSKKALFKVSVRFPSIHSLEDFMSENGSFESQLLALDEEYLLEPETASEILYRRVPPEEISDRSKEWSFWAVIRRRRFETEDKEGQETEEPNVMHNWSQRRTSVKASVERWCTGRCEMAEENMMMILEARGAAAGKPMQRPGLRNEAWEFIGDTGLLDHLLKPMAGKMAPGGADRFQRRHNADGAMEYWLEGADLVEIRKESGVQDAYWTPPQGWKPSDDPSQYPFCATMFKELWDGIARMKKREKKSKQPEQGLALVPTTSNSLVISMDRDQAYSSVLMQLNKDKYTQLAVRKSKFEEQMQQAPQILPGMEEKIMALSSMQAPRTAVMYYSEAAKLERLKSDFWICSTQGTSILLCIVTNSPPLSPVFTRVSSEIEKTISLSLGFKTLQINLNEIPGNAIAQHSESSTAIFKTLTYQRRQAPVMGYDDIGLKGTTCVAHISLNRIDVASDTRGSDKHGYAMCESLQKTFVDRGLLCTGAGTIATCREFIESAFAAARAVLGDVAHDSDIYVAVGVILNCITNWESTHKLICGEQFLVCRYSGGKPLVYKVCSPTLGGISCVSQVGVTVLIGSGSPDGQEFVREYEDNLHPQNLVESTIVYAALKDPSTGGHVHSVHLPQYGHITQYLVSVLQLLRRDFHLFAHRLHRSLFFLCTGLQYTSLDEPNLLQFIGNQYQRTRSHMISRKKEIIRIINFENLWDCIFHGRRELGQSGIINRKLFSALRCSAHPFFQPIRQ